MEVCLLPPTLTFDSGSQLVAKETSLQPWDPEMMKDCLQKKKSRDFSPAPTLLFPGYHETPTSDPYSAQLDIFEGEAVRNYNALSYF